MASSLRLGHVVWVEIADARGYRKTRPAVVVTPSDRISLQGTLEVVAVTSRLPETLPSDHVLLPWHPRRHPRTGLNRKCAAVCSWLARVRHSDVRDVAGVLPGAVLLDILKRIADSAGVSE